MFTHALDSIDIRWVGLNAKKHEILTVRNIKVGFLAFCSINTKCIEYGFTPFAPLRYSNKIAQERLEELKKVSHAKCRCLFKAIIY